MTLTEDDKAAIYAMQQRISDLLAGQATLQRTIHGLEVEVEELKRDLARLRASS